MAHAELLLALACIFGFLMAWGIGANDVANAMGTSVGSKALSLRQALIVAAIFETAGAVLAGGQVTSTIQKGIVDPTLFTATPELFVFGMLAALLAAGVWLIVASYFGWPVSTTHSIVGAIIGFGLVSVNADSIQWHAVITIAGSWVITPIIAGIIAYVVFISIRNLILNHPEPEAMAKRYLPFYIFFVAFILIIVTLVKGLAHVNLHISLTNSIIIDVVLSSIISLLGYLLVAWRFKPIDKDAKTSLRRRFFQVEKIFAILMLFTACAMAFAHGSNDIANAIGPLAAVFSIVKQPANLMAQSPLPTWILFFGAAGVVLGLAMYGHKVIATIGNNITELTPSRGFAASIATATTVVIASGLGLPISTTQTLVGAVLGVGLARGIAALNLVVIRGILMSWVITLPAGAILAIIFYYILRGVFALI